MLQKGVSIVMPCLNEAKTLPICIMKAQKSLQKIGIEGEIIVADNGSSDDSVNIAYYHGVKVVNVEKKGYGSALKEGIRAAKYEYIIMGDSDDSYDFSNISPFIEKLDEGYDLVMGNRFKGGIEQGAMPFSHRYIGNPLLSGLGRLFFKTDIGDFHCGLRAFRKESIDKIGLCTSGMEYASEMVVKAVLFHLKITEIPCKLYCDGRNRPSHLRSIPDGFRHMEFLLIYSPKWLFAYPGVFSFLLGLLLTVAIYIHPLHIGRIQFEATTMLYSALMMLIGIQCIQFSVFSSMYAERIGQIPKTKNFAHKVVKKLILYGYKISALVMIIGGGRNDLYISCLGKNEFRRSKHELDM